MPEFARSSEVLLDYSTNHGISQILSTIIAATLDFESKVGGKKGKVLSVAFAEVDSCIHDHAMDCRILSVVGGLPMLMLILLR